MFSTSNKQIWKLLAKHFAGETGEMEESALMEWRKSPENNIIYKNTNHDWNLIKDMKEQFNVDNAWSTLYKRITGRSDIEQTELHVRQKNFRISAHYRTFLRFAALILIIFGTGLILYTTGVFSGWSRNISIATLPGDEIEQVYLPDGSSVYLNSGTTLTYPKRFITGSRKVGLVGEAYFEVAADETNPFVISANNALVRAIGTSFNVNTTENEQQVNVFVESGRVELIEADNNANLVLLEPGDIGILKPNSIGSIRSDNKNSIAWKTKQMEFNNTEISDVLDILNDVYKVEIVIEEPGIDTTRIIGEYNNDPLDDILQVICTQNHLKIEKTDNKVYLSRIQMQ